jgi:hypothetical protein
LLYLFYLRKTKEAFCGLILFLAIFSLYLPKFIAKFIYVKNGFWIPVPGWQAPFITVGNFMLGYNSFLWAFTLCAAAAGIICVWALVDALRDKNNKIAFCVFLFIVPVTLIFLFSRFVFSVYLTRGLIIFSPYFYILLACGIFSLRGISRAIVLFLFSGLLALGIYGFFSDRMATPLQYHMGVFIKKPVKPIIDFLKRNARAGDAVAITNQSIMPSVSFYQGEENLALFYFFDPQYQDSSWKRPFQEDAVNIPLHKISRLKYDRFWVLSLNWSRDGNIDDNSQAVNARMSRDFTLEYVSSIEGVRILRYKRKSGREVE